jgi:hypothetical protein
MSTQRQVDSDITVALQRIQGNRKYCSSCSKMQPAEGFVKIMRTRGAVVKCGICAAHSSTKPRAGA